MKHFVKTIALFAGVLATGTLFAQGVKNGVKSKDKDKLDQYDEIVIKKKSDSDKDRKLTIEINKGVVTVNGKKVEEFNDDDLAVIQRKIRIHVNTDDMDFGDIAPIPPIPPMPPGARPNPQFRSKAYTINVNDSRGFLGVKTEKDNGAKVTEVTPGSPAEKAGLKVGDIITKVDDVAITSPEDLSKAVGANKPNEKITITYKRNKKDQKVTTTLGKRPQMDMAYDLQMPQDFKFDFDQKELDEQLRSLDEMRGDMKAYSFRGPAGPRLGIKAQDTEDGKGVKVLSVEDSSNAAKSGLKEGDIITSFDEKPVANTEQLVEASREAREKSTIPVKVIRNGVNQDLEIKIPRKLRTANL